MKSFSVILLIDFISAPKVQGLFQVRAHSAEQEVGLSMNYEFETDHQLIMKARWPVVIIAPPHWQPFLLNHQGKLPQPMLEKSLGLVVMQVTCCSQGT